MCLGCTRELIKQKKAAQLEHEMCAISVDNIVLQPLLRCRLEFTSIKEFRRTLSCLPTFQGTSRDDYIFGAARYLANTLGILIQSTYSSNVLDPPMTSIEKKQIWRKATFLCRCNNSPNIVSFKTRSFCKSCGYLVPVLTSIYTTKCPACNNFDSWECIGSPCLACQFARYYISESI